MAAEYSGTYVMSESKTEKADNKAIKEMREAKDAYFKERAKRIKSKKSY